MSSSHGCFCQSPSYHERAIERGDRAVAAEVGVHDHAARHLELGALGVERQVRHRQIVGDALAEAEPGRVHRADGRHVEEVDLVDEYSHGRVDTRDGAVDAKSADRKIGWLRSGSGAFEE